MKHIILGDVHLGRSVNIGKPGNQKELNSRTKDQIDLLDHVLKIASEDDYKHIIITGDIFQDARTHPAIVTIFLSWLKRCEKNKVKVSIIAGNHDIIRTGVYTVSALDIIPIVEMPYASVHRKVGNFNNGNVNFVFVPFRDKRMYDVESSKVGFSKLMEEIHEAKPFSSDVPNVMVGHFAIEGCLEVGDEIADSLNEIFISPTSFPECTHILMGHIHHPQVLQREGPFAAHVGSMDRSDFSKSEVDREKIIYIYDDCSHSIKQQILPTRELKHIDIDVESGKDSTDFVNNTLAVIDKRESLEESIVRLDIQLIGDVDNIDRNKVSEFLYKKLNVHHICKISESRIISSIVPEAGKLINTNNGLKTSVKLYKSQLTFKNEEEKDLYEKFSNECIEELENK
jgi:DNA repair exonuclease SbcCD nuclease subunit